mmetsp:Transcript_23801/g.39143  ORF Transcript_23801/g.39143 Transcript_23801/m.39143 type:complete len:236 (+) Transcript_23801:66-773(+)
MACLRNLTACLARSAPFLSRSFLSRSILLKRSPSSEQDDIPSREQCEQILHKLQGWHAPVLFDRVSHLSPNASASGIKEYSGNEDYLQGHFPQRPIVPAVVIVETWFQLAVLLSYVSIPPPEQDERMHISMDCVSDARFRAPVVPKMRAEYLVKLLSKSSHPSEDQLSGSTKQPTAPAAEGKRQVLLKAEVSNLNAFTMPQQRSEIWNYWGQVSTSTGAAADANFSVCIKWQQAV